MSPHNIDDIRNQLHEMARDRLFGSGPWEADEATYAAWHQQFIAWGLYKPYGNDGKSFSNTELGTELEIDLFTCFIGQHDLYEIPHVLAERGLLSTVEADDLVFRRLEANSEELENVLPPVLRRVYLERFGAEANGSLAE